MDKVIQALLSNISKLSGDKQTWNLEAFHSLLNQFAPKMFSFTPIDMECRVKLEDRSQKKKIMFLHSKNKASRKGYKGEC